MLDFQFGVAQNADRRSSSASAVAVFQDPYWAMPTVALRDDLVDQRLQRPALHRRAAQHLRRTLRGRRARRRHAAGSSSARITWPLIWPVTALVLTLQLILQLKIFDQVYLLTQGGPFNSTYVAGAVHLQAGLPAQPRRLCARRLRWSCSSSSSSLSVLQFQVVCARAGRRHEQPASSVVDALITLVTLVVACIWAFPLYWARRHLAEAGIRGDRAGLHLHPETLDARAYIYVLAQRPRSASWYVNSIVTVSSP